MGLGASDHLISGSIEVLRTEVSPLGQRISVVGWAFSRASPVSRIDMFLQDRSLGVASIGRLRPDVAEALGDEAAELSGFEFTAELTWAGWPNNRATLRARVTLLDGRIGELPAAHVTLAAAPADMVWPPNNTIRLLCIAQSLDRGGSQLRMRELVQVLGKSEQFGVTVLSPSDGPLRLELEAAGALVVIEPIPFDRISAYEGQLERIATWARGRFDVILGFTLLSFAAVDLAERLGLPSLWRIGDCQTLSTILGWLGRALDPKVELRADRAFASASAVFFNSGGALKYFQEKGYEGRFLVLGSGSDIEAADQYLRNTDRVACRRDLSIAPDRRLLVAAGTIWPVKGQALLVSALARTRQDHPELECVMLGQHNSRYAEALARLVARLGLTEVVRILPFSDNLSAWLRAADIAVSASEHESMSGSILEAMAFGLPVLATRVGGASEVVKEGETGWLCEPNDLGSLVDALRRAAEMDTEDLRALGAKARHVVREEHDCRDAHARTVELIKKIVADHGGEERPGYDAQAAFRLESAALVANHLLLLGIAPMGEVPTEVEVSTEVGAISGPIHACRLANDQNSPSDVQALRFIGVSPLSFDVAKVLAERSAVLSMTVRCASGAACEHSVEIRSFEEINLIGCYDAIRRLCVDLNEEDPEFAQILASLANDEQAFPSLALSLEYHLVAADCGFVAVGSMNDLSAQNVVFLLDGMMLAIDPRQIVQEIKKDELAVLSGGSSSGQSFACIEAIDGASHELRVAVLGVGQVRWSQSLSLRNSAGPRDLLGAIARLLAPRDALCLLAANDVLYQIAQQTSQPHRATATVTQFNEGLSLPEISIIIPFYGDDFFLLDHLESQRRTEANVEWVLVCDDPRLFQSMNDALWARRGRIVKPTKFVALSENVGFAPANNIALRHAAGDHVVFMNSDIYWRSFAPIDYATQLLKRDAAVGVVGFKLLFEDGTLQHGGMRVERSLELNDTMLLVHDGKGLPAEQGPTEISSSEVEAVTAALMVVRRRDFADGIFSEEYIGGDFEDGDLCLTMRGLGRKVVLVDCDGLYHLERQSIGSDPVHRLLSVMNGAWFNRKWQADWRDRQ